MLVLARPCSRFLTTTISFPWLSQRILVSTQSGPSCIFPARVTVILAGSSPWDDRGIRTIASVRTPIRAMLSRTNRIAVTSVPNVYRRRYTLFEGEPVEARASLPRQEPAGRHPEDPLEVPREVGLIVEPRLRRGLGDRQASGEQRLGEPDARDRLIRVG